MAEVLHRLLGFLNHKRLPCLDLQQVAIERLLNMDDGARAMSLEVHVKFHAVFVTIACLDFLTLQVTPTLDFVSSTRPII